MNDKQFSISPLLGVGNTFRLNSQSAARISSLSKQQLSQAEQAEKQLNQATPQQLDNFLKSQGRSLDAKSPEELKAQVLSKVSQAKKEIKTQAEATQSFRGLNLIKSSVKWNLGALVATGLFISIWKGTRWARTN
ncbi:HpsJ family protein [Plectonema radiosum]|uniref:HpsJ family protein n=1 Tax=Plectonema radiosum TaxID=945768 RepID=UPI0035C92724